MRSDSVLPLKMNEDPADFPTRQFQDDEEGGGEAQGQGLGDTADSPDRAPPQRGFEDEEDEDDEDGIDLMKGSGNVAGAGDIDSSEEEDEDEDPEEARLIAEGFIVDEEDVEQSDDDDAERRRKKKRRLKKLKHKKKKQQGEFATCTDYALSPSRPAC